VPTANNIAGMFPPIASIADRFPNGEAYSLPLLAVAIVFGWTRWKTSIGRLLMIVLGVILMSALGPRLHVAGHSLFGLPWNAMHVLPLIRDALPARFMMYASIDLAVITAICLSEAALPPTLRWLAVGVILILSLPNPGSWTVAADVPPFLRW
jgi:hypothetical protein